MKNEIHPEYYPKAKVSCACGNSFTIGATVPELRVDICSNCHPVYTGKMKYIDTAGRLDKFKTRLEKSRSIIDGKAVRVRVTGTSDTIKEGVTKR